MQDLRRPLTRAMGILAPGRVTSEVYFRRRTLHIASFQIMASAAREQAIPRGALHPPRTPPSRLQNCARRLCIEAPSTGGCFAFDGPLGGIGCRSIFDVVLLYSFLGQDSVAGVFHNVWKEIQLFSTVLVTGDNKEITIPNAKIQGNNLTNYTRLGRLRVDFVFGVSYADDLGKVKEVLADILAADPRVLVEPAPVIFVQALDDTSVNIAVRPWAKPDDDWTLQWDLPERVKLRFDAEGITIPFPQHDVHVWEGSGKLLDRGQAVPNADANKAIGQSAQR